MGVRAKSGVVLLVDKRVSSKLVVPQSIEKIFAIDTHVGCATSGLVADARALVDRARVEAQMNRVQYDEQIPVDILVKKICDFKQSYTQFGGGRPFGEALDAGAQHDGTTVGVEREVAGAKLAGHDLRRFADDVATAAAADRAADARKQEPQIIVDLRRRPHGRSWIANAVLLTDGDRRTDPPSNCETHGMTVDHKLDALRRELRRLERVVA